MFGYEILLNFNKQDEHKTLIGGFFSMLLFVILGVYFALCIKTLIFGEDNLRLTVLNTNDLEEMG